MSIYNKGQISKQVLLTEFNRLKKKLGHVPSKKEINLFGKYTINHYINQYGSYDEFLETVDTTASKVIEENLIQNYYDLKRKLEKQPTLYDLSVSGKYSSHDYLKTYGSFKNFLIKIREPVPHRQSDFTKEDLFREYLEVKNKLGKEPKIEDIQEFSKYHVADYQKLFGTWLDFKQELREFIFTVPLK